MSGRLCHQRHGHRRSLLVLCRCLGRCQALSAAKAHCQLLCRCPGRCRAPPAAKAHCHCQLLRLPLGLLRPRSRCRLQQASGPAQRAISRRRLCHSRRPRLRQGLQSKPPSPRDRWRASSSRRRVARVARTKVHPNCLAWALKMLVMQASVITTNALVRTFCLEPADTQVRVSFG
jgi:hypothetical protein